MSEQEPNPYQSNFDLAKPIVNDGLKRPFGLLLFCVVVLIFASMGLMGDVATGIMYATSGGAANYAGQYGANSPVNWHPDLLKKLMLLSPTHAIRNWFLFIVPLTINLLLIVSSVATLLRKSWGIKVFAFAGVLSIFIAISQAVLTSMTGGEVSAAIAEHGGEVLVAKDADGEEMAETLGGIMKFTFQMIPPMMWVWCVTKAIFYTCFLIYLRKKNVREYFVQGSVT
jgi:hypothetical protein